MKLGGGNHGMQPKGGLSGEVLDGGNSRSMKRLLLRNAFGNNGRMYYNNVRYVPDASHVTLNKKLNVTNNLYNAIKF